MPAGVLLMSHGRDTLQRATRSGTQPPPTLRQGGPRGARDGKKNGCSYRDYRDAVRNLHARLYLRFCEYTAGERPASPGSRRISRSCKPTQPFHYGHRTACERPAEKPRYAQEDTVGPDSQVEPRLCKADGKQPAGEPCSASVRRAGAARGGARRSPCRAAW